MVWALTPYDLPFPKMAVPDAPSWYVEFQMAIISATGDPIHFMFGSKGFQGRRVEFEWRYPR